MGCGRPQGTHLGTRVMSYLRPDPKKDPRTGLRRLDASVPARGTETPRTDPVKGREPGPATPTPKLPVRPT